MEKPKPIWGEAYFWLTVLAGGFFLSLTLWFSFGMDQSIYSYGAWVWKHYHLPPYVGAWDQNFPGIFILHRLALALFGESILGFRIFDFLVQLSCLVMIFHLSRRLSGSARAGFLSGLFYGIYYYGLGNYDTGQRDGYVFWLLLIALVLSLTLKHRTWLRAALVGLVLGFAFLVKPFYGLAWPVFGVWFLLLEIKDRPQRALIGLALFSLACLVPSGLIVLYYEKLGYLRELYRATLWYGFMIYSGAGHDQAAHLWWFRFALTISSISWEAPLLFSAIFIVLRQWKNKNELRDRQLFGVLTSLMAAALICYRLQGKFFPYQLLPFMGLMMIFSGIGWNWIGSKLMEGIEAARRRLLAVAFPLVLILLLIISTNHELILFSIKYDFRNLDRAYLAGMNDSSDLHNSSNNYLVAKKLSSLAGAGDEIEYFGPYPLIAFVLKKKLPSRFCCVQHLLFLPSSGRLGVLQKEWIEEYTAAVIQARPRFFLVSDVFPGQTYIFFNFAANGLKQALREQFPALQKFLDDNYELMAREGVIEIYELRKAAPASPSPGGREPE